MLSYWNITLQAQLYNIPPGLIILATGQTVYGLNYPLYVAELQLPVRNLLFDLAEYQKQDLSAKTERMLYHKATSAENHLKVK